jgi:hypothetical protein
MRERDIRKALRERVMAYGGEIRAVSWLGRRHAPDVLCLFPMESKGRGYYTAPCHPFIETKAPGGVPTAAQAREHVRLWQAACTVLVISTIEQLDKWLPPLP